MKQKRFLERIVLFSLFICITSLWGCGNQTVENTLEDSFYERSQIEPEKLGKAYQSQVDTIYQNAYERFTSPSIAEELEGKDVFDKVNRKLLSGYHRTYRVFRSLSPVIVVCSVSIGILMMVLARQNKKVKRTGLFVFIIGVPFSVIVAVFGIGILNGILLY